MNILFYGGASLLSNIWSKYWKDKFNIFLGLNNKWIEIEGIKSVKLNKNVNELDKIIKKYNINLIINCAGLTSVEECEKNKDLAFYLNGYLPGEIAKVTFKSKIRLIHISTDHLFDGISKNYDENSKPNPLNIYSKSKLLGEQEVLKYHENSIIIRTNFFGNGPNYRASFSDKIINMLLKNEKILLFDNVFYTPISVNELADVTQRLLKKNCFGIFNVVSNERITKFDFGLSIVKHLKLNKGLILPIKIEGKKHLVKRPKDMSLSNKKLQNTLGYNVKPINNQISEIIKNFKIDAKIL